MLLIDAVYINNGGGKILLDYLISQLENIDIDIFYLLDVRLKPHTYKIKNTNIIAYARPNLQDRYLFYKSHRNSFSKIFVLGNVPPLIKVNAHVITYYHSLLFLNLPKEYNIIEKLKNMIKVSIIRYASKNTDKWLVQSEEVKRQFLYKFGQEAKVDIVPFFPIMHLTLEKSEKNIRRISNTFLFVSIPAPHKNHIRLIEAFCRAYDKTHVGKLTLTITNNYPNIINLIRKKVDEGYPIENIGFVDRKTLSRKYAESQYVIFPSLTESFGLGLIEGISLGCKIIGANLPYTFAVCEPSLVFNPLNIESIEKAIIEASNNKLKESVSKISNQIETLVNILSAK